MDIFKNENPIPIIVGSFFLLFVLSACAILRTEMPKDGNPHLWTGSWTAAPQLVEPGNMPPFPGLANNTLRQVIRVSLGGDRVRLQFSNAFGNAPVTIQSVVIAPAREDGSVDAATQKALRFEGNGQVVIMPESVVVSDPLAFHLAPGSRLAITIAFGETPEEITGHPGSRTTSFLVEGNQCASDELTGAVLTDHWYVISGLEVLASPAAGAVAVLGNSITDGRGSGTNKQNRWTDILSERLLKDPQTSRIGVLNQGIGGNCVVRGGLGPTALDRFDRDILSQSNVRWLIILEGINDIGGISSAEEAPKMAQTLIEAYSLMIDKAKAKGMKVYGATILPFGGSFYDTDFRRQARDTVNEWIRRSGRFDAVIDFDEIMRNPTDPAAILPDMHDNDFLHPNEAGYRKMGEYIDLNLFK
ncbi:SGNH/GDSL hydrolase family protein [Proteiniphilum sp. X52]|uniref:SGNH/GDSL hydrolase family protein n=1 Tax=Proteiniphilum sp. X52 TaxID=2382159 RepID=UPI000F09DF7E|nr:SGNH/GDSL hydrolase family protein [Proteiniphilum sp. X52]RNC65538.1 SGNH/GDSL hydrolase family protein [Proteiniphilum sp. X52]